MENYSVAEQSIQSTTGSFGEGEINILPMYLLMPLYISIVGVKSLLLLQHYCLWFVTPACAADKATL